MDLLPFFEWCEASAIGQFVRDSQWLFPVIEALHLVAFSLIGGALLVVDLRQFGVGLRRQSSQALARDVHPWLVGGVTAMVITGVLLFLSEAVKCYYNTSFWVKMTTLAVALAFTFTLRLRTTRADEGRANPNLARLVAIISIVLWGTVAWAGRWIGFS